MTSGAGALVPDLQRCIDSNRDLAERLYVLVQIDVEHVSLHDHRQMLKHFRCVLDYLFLVISNAGQNLPQPDIEKLSRMLRSCKTDQDLLSGRLLQIEKLPAFAAILSAVPKDKRTWVSVDPQKSYFLNRWLEETPVVFSSRDEEGTRKPMEQRQQLQQREGSPDVSKGPNSIDLTTRTAPSGTCIPPLSASQAGNLGPHVLAHHASPTSDTVFPKTPAGLIPLGNEVQQPNKASGIGPHIDSNDSTRSISMTGKSAPHGEVLQSAAIALPDNTDSTSSRVKKRKRRQRRGGKVSSTEDSVSRGETPKSATIALPDTTQSTAPPKKKRKRQSKGARPDRQLEAMKTIATVVNQDIATNVNKRPVSEEADHSGSSRPVTRMQMDDLALSQQRQGQSQEPTSQDPIVSSPLRRYQGKKHLTQGELVSLKAYTLDLLRDLQAEAGRGAFVDLSPPEAKPPPRRSKAEDFF